MRDMVSESPFQVQVLRTTMVRVTGTLDDEACTRLERILLDLIQNHGISGLVVDLSGADAIGHAAALTLESAQTHMEQIGGHLEVRAPAESPTELVDLAEDIPTFVPIDTGGSSE